MVALERTALCLSLGLAAIACAPSGAAPAPAATASTEALPSVGSSVLAGSAPALVVADAPSCRPLPSIARLPGPPPDRPHLGVAAPGLAPGLPANAPTALVKTCRRLEASNLLAEKAIPSRRDAAVRAARPLATGRCFSAPNTRGAWIVDVTPQRPTPLGGKLFHHAGWWLRYVSPDGKTHQDTVPNGDIDTADGEWGDVISVLGVNDLDGDGVAEVLVGDSRHLAIDFVREAAITWAFREETVRPLLTEISHRGWLDVDGDGRIDLLLPPRPGLSLFGVAHALPDGRFVADDDVARAALAQSCPAAPRGPLRDEHQVACALAWGAPREAVLGRIDDGKPTAKCRRSLLALAAEPAAGPLLVGTCEREAPAAALQGSGGCP